MMTCTLSSLPSEILDLIACHIDGRIDILCFGLTSKQFFNVVNIRHLKYREIGPFGLTKEHNSQIWSDLAEHPERARNVRRLSILFNFMLRGKAERQVFLNEALRAIGHMQSLTDLSIEDCEFSFKPITAAYSEIWRILRGYCSLRTLRLVLNPGYNFFSEQHFQRIASLETLEVATSPVSLLQQSYLFGMTAFYDGLQRLAFNLRGSRVDSYSLGSLSLPNLKSFSIRAKALDGDRGHFDMFLHKHPGLVELDLSFHSSECEELGQLGSVDFSLPSLEVVSGGPSFIQHVFLRSTDPPYNVVCVKGIDLCNTSDDALRRIDDSKIRKLDVGKVGALENVYRFKNLQWLRVVGDEVILDADVGFYRVLSPAEWAAVFAHLPYLRVFRGVCFIGDPDESDDAQDRTEDLCNIAPRLEFIDHWADPDLAIRLIRNTEPDYFVGREIVSSSFADSFVADRNS